MTSPGSGFETEKGTAMNKILSTTLTTTITLVALSGTVAYADRPGPQDRCHLSLQEVAELGRDQRPPGAGLRQGRLHRPGPPLS